MEYSLNAGEWNKVFAVPSSIVDKYLKLASGNALKLLLYLMRHGGESFTAEILRAELGFEELGELEDAALFWVQRGIISAKNTKNALSLAAAGSDIVDINRENIEVQKIPEKRSTVIKAKPAVISNGDIGRSIKSSPEIKMLFDEAEKLFGRTLHANERQTIAQLTEHYGLPCDVSLMLLHYCFKEDKLKPA
ncbi:MAG: DnaD domain protein, partial [Oscillospiraceae bacterium]|nr:DnaD domain protein [Oscillospiraceae bacterium]